MAMVCLPVAEAGCQTSLQPALFNRVCSASVTRGPLLAACSSCTLIPGFVSRDSRWELDKDQNRPGGCANIRRRPPSKSQRLRINVCAGWVRQSVIQSARSGLGRLPFCLALSLVPPTSATQIMGERSQSLCGVSPAM